MSGEGFSAQIVDLHRQRFQFHCRHGGLPGEPASHLSRIEEKTRLLALVGVDCMGGRSTMSVRCE